MKPVWQIMITALSDLTNTKNNLIQAVTEAEEQLRKKSFSERALQLIPEKKENN